MSMNTWSHPAAARASHWALGFWSRADTARSCTGNPRERDQAADTACVTPGAWGNSGPAGGVRERSVPYTQVKLGWSGVLPTRVVKLAGCLREAFGGSRCRPGPRAEVQHFFGRNSQNSRTEPIAT